MESAYLYIKALHLIFVVSWFAALFYMPRLLAYHSEAQGKEGREIIEKQLLLMMRRLWLNIAIPAALLTLISGGTLLLILQDIPEWLFLKILFLALLYAFHFFLQNTLGRLQSGKGHRYTSKEYRLWNELPTLLLFAIVFLAITKRILPAFFALGGIALGIGGFFIVKKLCLRKRK